MQLKKTQLIVCLMFGTYPIVAGLLHHIFGRIPVVRRWLLMTIMLPLIKLLFAIHSMRDVYHLGLVDRVMHWELWIYALVVTPLVILLTWLFWRYGF